MLKTGLTALATIGGSTQSTSVASNQQDGPNEQIIDLLFKRIQFHTVVTIQEMDIIIQERTAFTLFKANSYENRTKKR